MQELINVLHTNALRTSVRFSGTKALKVINSSYRVTMFASGCVIDAVPYIAAALANEFAPGIGEAKVVKYPTGSYVYLMISKPVPLSVTVTTVPHGFRGVKVLVEVESSCQVKPDVLDKVVKCVSDSLLPKVKEAIPTHGWGSTTIHLNVAEVFDDPTYVDPVGRTLASMLNALAPEVRYVDVGVNTIKKGRERRVVWVYTVGCRDIEAELKANSEDLSITVRSLHEEPKHILSKILGYIRR